MLQLAHTIARRSRAYDETMPKASKDTIEKLEQRKRALEIKLKALKTQQKREERKKDARRKILVGSALVAAVEAGRVSEALFGQIIDEFVTKEKDRAFLGLSVSREEAYPTETPSRSESE